MARGSQPGERRGGRQKGTPNRASAERQEAVAASGMTPLDFMLSVMRDTDAARDLRLDAAHKAAPYVHAKLSSVEARVELDGVLQVTRVELVDLEPE